MGQRKLNVQRGSLPPGSTVEFVTGTQNAKSAFDVRPAMSFAPAEHRCIEALAIVFNHQTQTTIGSNQVQYNRARLGVFHHIGQPFLNNTVKQLFRFEWQSLFKSVTV